MLNAQGTVLADELCGVHCDGVRKSREYRARVICRMYTSRAAPRAILAGELGAVLPDYRAARRAELLYRGCRLCCRLLDKLQQFFAPAQKHACASVQINVYKLGLGVQAVYAWREAPHVIIHTRQGVCSIHTHSSAVGLREWRPTRFSTLAGWEVGAKRHKRDGMYITSSRIRGRGKRAVQRHIQMLLRPWRCRTHT